MNEFDDGEHEANGHILNHDNAIRKEYIATVNTREQINDLLRDTEAGQNY